LGVKQALADARAQQIRAQSQELQRLQEPQNEVVATLAEFTDKIRATMTAIMQVSVQAQKSGTFFKP
jgi:hypothetical protein